MEYVTSDKLIVGFGLVCLVLGFCNGKDGTQGLTHARHALYHTATPQPSQTILILCLKSLWVSSSSPFLADAQPFTMISIHP